MTPSTHPWGPGERDARAPIPFSLAFLSFTPHSSGFDLSSVFAINMRSMKSSQPSLWNGPTVHGPFGRSTLRHPWELPLLMFVGLTTAGGLALYWWALTAPDALCDTGLENALFRGYLSYLPKACVRFRDTSEILSIVLLIVIALAVGIWVGRAFIYANLRAQGVRMSPTQFPEAYRMVIEAAERTGLRKAPDAYVILGNGRINAYASGHGHRRFVAVYSDLFEIGGSARDPQALRFVINHEVGHLAAGHVSFFRLLFMSIGSFVPILGPALLRAQEYTADNYGYEGAPDGAAGIIGVLSAGKYLGAHVNFNAMADRAGTERGFWLHTVNWASSHPVLTWRAQALRDRGKPGRLMIKPPIRSAVYSSHLLAGQARSRGWPTPEWAAEMLRTTKPVTDEEQFGRYPGLTYSAPADVLRLSDPAGIPIVRDPGVPPNGIDPTSANL